MASVKKHPAPAQRPGGYRAATVTAKGRVAQSETRLGTKGPTSIIFAGTGIVLLFWFDAIHAKLCLASITSVFTDPVLI